MGHNIVRRDGICDGPTNERRSTMAIINGVFFLEHSVFFAAL